MKVNKINWNYAQYHNSPLKAFISYGADLEILENGDPQPQFYYFVTVTDSENTEIFQSSHKDLEDAIEIINNKYSHWEYKEAKENKDGDGCSTCAAH